MKELIKDTPFARPLQRIRREVSSAAEAIHLSISSRNTPKAIKGHDKLHLGAGPRYLEGWANIDREGKRNFIWDLRKPLPLPDHSVRFVYTEHFVEHLTREDNLSLFNRIGKILGSSGVLRISTPDLHSMVKAYLEGRIVAMENHKWRPATPCQMMNELMRNWEHRFIFDENEIRLVLNEAGFSKVERVRHSQSEHPELRNLESRPDFNDLIVEAS